MGSGGGRGSTSSGFPLTMTGTPTPHADIREELARIATGVAECCLSLLICIVTSWLTVVVIFAWTNDVAVSVLVCWTMQIFTGDPT